MKICDLNSLEKVAIDDLIEELHSFWKAVIPNKRISFQAFLEESARSMKEAKNEYIKENKPPKTKTEPLK